MQYFDFTVPVGSTRQIHIRSSYVRYAEGNAGGLSTTIALRKMTGSETILMRPGQSFQLPEGDTTDSWVITNHDGLATISGLLFIGSGSFVDNRISGSVEVIDGGKNRTLSNSAFMGYLGLAALAAKFANLQLWNPAASGKNLIVEQIIVGGASAGAFLIRKHNAAILTLETRGLSKKAYGADGLGEVRKEHSDAPIGTGASYTSHDYAAGIPFILRPAEPFVLPPGSGIIATGYPVGSQFTATYEWYEEKSA